MRIAVDAMGGDTGPDAVVPGALDAVARDKRITVVLVGNEERLRGLLKVVPERIEIVHASQEIGMSEAPATAFRKKTDSSIAVGIGLLREKKVDAFVSAGNTGAVVATSLVRLGRLQGVSRPAIAVFFPNKKQGTVLLDVGANHECTPKNIHQFAVMGSAYAEYNLEFARPGVGLLNIGEESSKGNDMVRDAYRLLESDPAIRFVGNVEGRDVFDGVAEVVVCDGFVGNVILKFSESVFSFITHVMRMEINKGVIAKAGAVMMKGVFDSVKSRLNYEEYGGAPLLGVNGVVIISHGKSSPLAIRNAILAAVRSVSAGLNIRIEERFKEGADVANA